MVRPITQVTEEKQMKIVEIRGGMKAKSKLNDRGICVGECICVPNGSCRHGDLVLKTKTSKFAMGFGLASKIIVEDM